jgi:hypothetical protein
LATIRSSESAGGVRMKKFMFLIFMYFIFLSFGFLQKEEKKGLTWGKHLHDVKNNIDLVGCYAKPGAEDNNDKNCCNAYEGDTKCSKALPILCIKKDGSQRPNYEVSGKSSAAFVSEYYYGWAEGQIALTPPIKGCDIGSLENANCLCEKYCGKGYQMAEHHDGKWIRGMNSEKYYGDTWTSEEGKNEGGWNFWAYGNISNESRFWVYIRDQQANCWMEDRTKQRDLYKEHIIKGNENGWVNPLFSSCSALDSTKNKPTQLDVFLSTDFEVITTTRTFPVGVNTYQVMANPGQSYNMTDTGFIEDPYQRLIFGGKSDSLWFVYYEQGGMQYGIYLVLFKPTAKGFETLWTGHLLFNRTKSLRELKAVVSKCSRLPNSKDSGGFTSPFGDTEKGDISNPRPELVENPISSYKVLFGKSRERPSDFNFLLNYLSSYFEVNTFNNTLTKYDTTISFQFTFSQMDSIYEQMINMDIISYPSDFQPSNWEETSPKLDSVNCPYTFFKYRANNETKQITWTHGILSSEHKALMFDRFILLIKGIVESSPRNKQFMEGSKK